ncbi:SusD family protein [compost metagenome]
MEAELIARTGGSVTDALKPLNEMRAAKTSIVLPALTASSLNEFYDVLFKEIWVELALENGSEWFASLRFMKDGKPWVYSLKKEISFDENKYCWPVPDAEMLNNKLATQNPGLN